MDTPSQAALSLDEAMAQLAAIVESSDDAIISKTLGGVILTWNAAAERIYGYSFDEAIGRKMAMLLPGNRPDEESEILARIAVGERVEHFETVRRTRGGKLIDVSLSISPTRDKTGRITGASHIARDITNRKRMEEQLQQFAAIVESSDDAIISKTLDGVILTWNAAAERIYGYSSPEATGRQMSMLLPDNRPDEESEMLARVGRGERVEHVETVRRTKAGVLIDVSLTISPIHDKDGRICGGSHVSRDITDRKRMDDQLRHTQKLESLGILAGGVAHDFNNLLTGIMGNASLALEDVSENDSTAVLLRDVVDASERAASLTRQLLAYAGRGRFIVQPVDLSALIRDIGRLLHTSISKGVLVQLHLRAELPPVLADVGQMQQLIMNLVINAAEAIGPDSSGTVTVETAVQQVDDGFPLDTSDESGKLPRGEYVTVEVRDTGCGMDEGTLRRIFDPFFTTKLIGRGLGLSAVQGIVSGHKGLMKVYSQPGQGTTFKVFLPITEEPISHLPANPVIRAASGEVILIVDDEEMIRRTARAMLEYHGYNVLVAESGKRAVELVELGARKISLVLLDMTMPELNGEGTYRRIKQIRPDLRIVLSSGYNESAAIRRFTGGDTAGFIQKPYTSKELIQKLSETLRPS